MYVAALRTDTSYATTHDVVIKLTKGGQTPATAAAVRVREPSMMQRNAKRRDGPCNVQLLILFLTFLSFSSFFFSFFSFN
mmetsp:Transcript_24337/g.45552  ORF Transcript_24337/g.45552 Transcript_24337/m.45552 type:complete len:80 (+) Transcript_24337:92-331(+)